MQTIITALNPAKLPNPDLDLRYDIPERIKTVFNDAIRERSLSIGRNLHFGKRRGRRFKMHLDLPSHALRIKCMEL